MLASYEFRLKDGEVIRGTTLYRKIQRLDRQPQFPGSKIRCDLDRVDFIITSDKRFAPKIYWSDEVFGREGNAKLLLEDRDGIPLDIALFEVLEDQVWIVRSEPTVDNRIGITVSNSKGKVLFTGIGDLTEVDFTPLRAGLKPKKGHVLTFVFKEIYSWRRSSPMECTHTTGAIRKGSPADPDYSAPDGGSAP